MLDILFSKSAEKEFLKLPKTVQKTIKTKIIGLANGTVQTGIKKLTNREEYRLRVGDYRVLYTIENSISLIIVAIGHRKDIYL